MHKLLIYKRISILWHGTIGLSFALILMVSGGAYGQPIDSLDLLFTIREIKVDERAANASAARRSALAAVESIAYEKLLQKITQPEGRALLPELTAPQIQTLISGIEVVDEQSSSRRYIATLNVRFEPVNVSQFLAEHGVPHVLSTGRGILVLHAHSDALNEFLWQSSEAMVAAQTSVDWLNRIRQYVFPRGELRERAAVTYSEIEALEATGADTVAGYQGVKSILMIASAWENKPGGGKLTYRFLSSDEAMQGEGAIEQDAAGSQTDSLSIMFETILEKIDTAWRDQLLVDTGTGGDMEALVPNVELQILADIENRLAEVTLVQGVKILSVGLPFSKIGFHYTGREDQLILALRYAGLYLGEYGDQKIIKLSEALD